jgi:hypothetical protein
LAPVRRAVNVLCYSEVVEGIAVWHDDRFVHVGPTKAQRKKKSAGPAISLDMIFEGAGDKSVDAQKNARRLSSNRA